MIKVAVVGLGGMGSSHYNIYKEMADVRLVALVDIREEMVKQKAVDSGARAYTSIDDMLEAEEVDIVDICTPSYTHAELSIKAMKCRHHVLCEKPAALNCDDIKRVYKAAEENSVFFMAAHVIRFWYEYEWLKAVVDSDKYGKLKHLSLWRVGEKPIGKWENWMLCEEKSGLVPLDLHIHDVDYMVYLLGVPENATAFEIRDGEEINFISANYSYKQGVSVDAKAAWYSGKIPFSMGYEAVFEKAFVKFADDKLTIYPNDAEAFVLDSTSYEAGLSEINVTNTSGYKKEIAYFIDCVNNGIPPQKVKEEELLAVMTLIKSVIK